MTVKEVKKQIDGLVFRFVSLMYENGEETALEGVTLLNADNDFIKIFKIFEFFS